MGARLIVCRPANSQLRTHTSYITTLCGNFVARRSIFLPTNEIACQYLLKLVFQSPLTIALDVEYPTSRETKSCPWSLRINFHFGNIIFGCQCSDHPRYPIVTAPVPPRNIKKCIVRLHPEVNTKVPPDLIMKPSIHSGTLEYSYILNDFKATAKHLNTTQVLKASDFSFIRGQLVAFFTAAIYKIYVVGK